MKKQMRKTIATFATVLMSLILVSTVTALPQVEGDILSDSYEQEQLQAAPIINIDDLMDYFTSEEFAEYMNSYKVQEVLNGDIMLSILNLEETQAYIASDAFQDFTETEEAETFLENYGGLYLSSSETDTLLFETLLILTIKFLIFLGLYEGLAILEALGAFLWIVFNGAGIITGAVYGLITLIIFTILAPFLALYAALNVEFPNETMYQLSTTRIGLTTC